MDWNVKGKTALVTGATSGIGLEAAVVLARAGASVVMVGRDAKKTDACVASVKERSGSQDVRSLLCDFAKLSEVRKLAAQVLETCPRLEILINNAGTAYAERSETVDGFESTFAVNHLGSFLLTKLLMDRVIASAPARIVNTASTGHYQGHLDFEDLGYTKGRYSSFGAYARSKLANVAFTIELGRRLEGKGLATISMHPGAVATNIWANVKPWQRPIIKVLGLFFISSEEGGGYLARLAIEPSLQTAKGLYVEKTQVKTPSKEARDPAVQAKLWEVSEAMVAAKV